MGHPVYFQIWTQLDFHQRKDKTIVKHGLVLLETQLYIFLLVNSGVGCPRFCSIKLGGLK